MQEIQQEIQMSFKIVLLGESSVGKTSILYRFTNDDFIESQIPTIGMAFSKKVVERNNMRISLEIWDTAGQEKYRKIAPIYYRNAQGVIIVIDLTRGDGIDEAKKWLDEVEEYLNQDSVKFLVGNKSDLIDDIRIEKEAEEFAKQRGMSYLSVSAKNGVNIQQLFRRISRSLAKNRLRKLELIEQKQTIKLNKVLIQEAPLKRSCTPCN